jgi:hypothetical protein
VIAASSRSARPATAGIGICFLDQEDGNKSKPWSLFILGNIADALEKMSMAA